MLRDVLIVTHAATALAASGLGARLLYRVGRPPAVLRGSLTYLLTTVGMTIAAAGAVAVEWSSLAPSASLAFAALTALAVYMCARAWMAHQLARTRPDGWRPTYTDHVGFTLISYFAGFTVVAALNAGASGLIAAAIAVAGVVVGRRTVRAARRRAVAAATG